MTMARRQAEADALNAAATAAAAAAAAAAASAPAGAVPLPVAMPVAMPIAAAAPSSEGEAVATRAKPGGPPGRVRARGGMNAHLV
jgi:hypothetical protein